ncbi:MAG: AAA family ATPase [Sulfuricella sp.]|nr:AAA family ATPase [Sulfuricella sp.]
MYIAYVEISNFRKLLSVRIDLSKETTLFVGANNSGKTSAILALRKFLVDKGKRFRTQDFTLSHWRAINALGKTWEDLLDEEVPALSAADWEPLLPSLDLWLKVEDSELHHVRGLLPTLDWAGGMLGVRMRLEPKDMEALYREYRTATSDVRALHKAAAATTKLAEDGEAGNRKKLTLWPVSLIDFLGRKLSQHLVMRAYLLDPAKLAPTKDGQAFPQLLAVGALPLESDPLQGLIRVNEISAQRGLGESDGVDIDGTSNVGRDSQKLSDQLCAYYTKHLDPFETPDVADLTALQAIEAAQEAFDQRLHASFEDAFTEVESMGYPGVSNPKLKIASRLKAVDGLDHEAAVSFEIEMSNNAGGAAPLLHLPESYNGLGYQNLISMIFRLMSFRDAWMRVGKAAKSIKEEKIEPIHLVLVEEPEAHLHAQVQQVFINKAYKVLRDHNDLNTNSTLHTQLVVSTHSSHVAHETSFSCLRYFRRLPAGMVVPIPISTVINLSGVFGEGTETERFVTRYLRAQHSDLFFADAAILVEGPAEKMLVPNFIRERYPYLTQCYITLLEINGSHAHRLKPLIEALGLLTLVITDLDAGEAKGGKTVAAQPKRASGQATNNTSLKEWAPRIKDVDGLLSAKPEDKECIGDQLFAVRIAYQLPVNIAKEDGTDIEEALPSTFEDALAFENIEFFKTLEGYGLVCKFREALVNNKGAEAIGLAMFEALRNGSKAAFSLDIILSKDFTNLKCPRYIGEGLEWLEGRLRTKQVDVLPLSSEELGATA